MHRHRSAQHVGADRSAMDGGCDGRARSKFHAEVEYRSDESSVRKEGRSLPSAPLRQQVRGRDALSLGHWAAGSAPVQPVRERRHALADSDRYSWNLSVAASIAMGAQISEVDEALQPLIPLLLATDKHSADEAWFQNWMKLGEKLAALAGADAERGNGFSASSKFSRAANYFLIAERIAS